MGQTSPMAHVQADIVVRRRWFFWPALVLIVALGKIGLIRDKVSPAHHGGIETGQERAGRWIADHAMRIEVR